MLLKRSSLLRIIAEVTFLCALAFPMIKSISNVGWLYIFFQAYADIVSLILYLIILILFPALFPNKKKLSSYIKGIIIFLFYTMYLIMSSPTISPSFILMIIVCFGRPFWEFHLKSINIFIVIIILLLVLLSLNIQNLLVLLSAVDLGGQNYIAALVFGTVYLGYFFYLKTKPTRGVLATSIGTVLLLFLRSRTAILAVSLYL